MSLYEVLDRFVATGVLACAGLVGAELPAGAPLDSAQFSARLGAHNLAEPYGTALDTLAHTIWFARERHGIPLEIAERHATELTNLLAQVRFAADEIAAAFTAAREKISAVAGGTEVMPSARLAELWLAKAAASGAIEQAGLDIEISRYLLTEMLALIVDRAPLLNSLAPALAEHRTSLAAMPSAPQMAPQQIARLAGPSPTIVATGSAGPGPQSASTVPDGALRRLKAILAHQPMSAEQRLARLDELSAWLAATVVHLRKPTNEAPELRSAKLDAANTLEAGDFERAMERLKSVRDHMREDRRRTEARIAEELQVLRAQMTEEASATARMGELALARMDLEIAADYFADAAGQLPAGERAQELVYRMRQAETLAAKAETAGDLHTIEAAAQAFRKCRSLIAADTESRTKVRINVGLGDMLMACGARRPTETIALDEAVAAFSDAITAIDRAAKPMQWALVQLSHAAALIELGQRSDRDQRWKAAASALMPALELFESRGASDLAEAARAKLRMIAVALEPAPENVLLPAPARSA